MNKTFAAYDELKIDSIIECIEKVIQPYILNDQHRETIVDLVQKHERNEILTAIEDGKMSYLKAGFNEQVIDRFISNLGGMVKGYRQHQIESHAEQTHELEAIRKRLKVISREASNIVDLMAKTASTRLIERLNELEHEEVENKHRLEQLEATIQITHVDEKEFKKMFRTARKLFKTGTLPTTKRLIDMFVDKIIIHSDHVEVMLKISPKFHSHESLPKDENEHNMGLLPIKKCAGYDGGEGGI